MGLARLNVWFADINHPCKKVQNAGGPLLRVNIYDCDGIFQWCGRKYQGIVAPCGHVEILLPPGCYLVAGTVAGSIAIPGHPPGDYPNYDTDLVKVDLCCDDHVCITLIPHNLHSCIWWANTALQTHLALGTPGLPLTEFKEAIAVLTKIEGTVPQGRFSTTGPDGAGIRRQLIADAKTPMKDTPPDFGAKQ
jgi:hypothetical protein